MVESTKGLLNLSFLEVLECPNGSCLIPPYLRRMMVELDLMFCAKFASYAILALEENSQYSRQIKPFYSFVLCMQAMLEGYRSQKCINYLVDGFPRNEDNKSGWEASMSDKAKVLQVVVLDCPDSVSLLCHQNVLESLFQVQICFKTNLAIQLL